VHAVQPHLSKCFDAIKSLEFGGPGKGNSSSQDILAMCSPEGERVGLTKVVKARGNVENWLGKVEETMVITLRTSLQKSIADLLVCPRQQWIFKHPAQV